MSPFLDEIAQVSIYFVNDQDQTERVNEVALYQPLAKNALLDESLPALQQRKWSFASTLPFSKRVALKITTFFFQKFPKLVQERRLTNEAKFKTVLALILSQESLADFFLENEAERKSFFAALQNAATHLGYHDFISPPFHLSSDETARFLTKINEISLLDDIEELNLQLGTLKQAERDEILFHILNNIRRPPLTSVIEVATKRHSDRISIKTSYSKYKVTEINEETGQIVFNYEDDKTNVSIKTEERLITNQHKIVDVTDKNHPYFLMGVSGELLHFTHVLEQILFLLQIKGECFIEKYPPYVVDEKVIIFTSLFSWNEYDKIVDEHFAIEKWHGKILKFKKETGEITYVRLSLHHQNIPFNAFNKFPNPAEMRAAINDINDKTLLFLCSKILDYFPLNRLAHEYEMIRQKTDFIRKENDLLKAVDTFHRMKDEILTHIDSLTPAPVLTAIKALLSKKLPNNKTLHPIDMLNYLSLLIDHYSFIHNINCDDATDRSAGAISLIKAQNAYKRIAKTPFLPGSATLDETSLFRVFYSMYLVFEEPELNAGLTTGFVGEKFYQNFLQRNPETTFYLIPWLKKHPEMYLGLSNYRK